MRIIVSLDCEGKLFFQSTKNSKKFNQLIERFFDALYHIFQLTNHEDISGRYTPIVIAIAVLGVHPPWQIVQPAILDYFSRR